MSVKCRKKFVSQLTTQLIYNKSEMKSYASANDKKMERCK